MPVARPRLGSAKSVGVRLSCQVLETEPEGLLRLGATREENSAQREYLLANLFASWRGGRPEAVAKKAER